MFTRQWRYMVEHNKKKHKKKVKKLNTYEAFELMHKNDGTLRLRKDKNE